MTDHIRVCFARWESRGKKHFVDLYEHDYTSRAYYSYETAGGGGNLPSENRAQAIQDIEGRLAFFNADAARTPLRRVL